MTSYTAYINPGNSYFVAPFAHDLSTVSNGSIYYRITNNASILNQIGLEISSLKNGVHFTPTNAFIVTWDTVAAFSWPINGYVSFQIILSTDGSNSFLTTNYGAIVFSPSNGYSFQCGPDCYTYISNTNPEYSSNVGVDGKWIYNISNSKFKYKIRAYNFLIIFLLKHQLKILIRLTLVIKTYILSKSVFLIPRNIPQGI